MRALLSPLRVLLLLLVAAGLVYGASLMNGFTNWDDWVFIKETPSIAAFDLRAMFTQTTLGHFYPLNILTLALDYQICGPDNAFCYHLTSLLFHVLNALCVFLLLNRFLAKSPSLALFGALLFLLHPVQVESVAWVAARNHLVSGLGYFALLWVYLRYLDRPSRSGYIAVLLSFGLALLTKSTLALAPLLLLLLDAQRAKPRVLEKLPMFAAGLWVIWITYRANAIPQVPTAEIYGMSLLERLLWAVNGLFFYVRQFLIPYPIVPYYDFRELPLGALSFIPLLALATASAMIAWRNPGQRRHLLIFAWAFFLLTIGPNLKIIPFGEFSFFNDRYLYVSSFGLILLLCVLLEPLFEHLSRWKIAAASALLVALAAMSFHLTGYWKDGETFWNSVLGHFPNTAMALNNLGRVYLDRGETDRAKPYFEHAVRVRPDFALPYYNLGLVAQKLGNIPDAVHAYGKAAEVNPGFLEARSNQGALLAKMGRITEAMSVLEEVAAKRPALPEVYFNLALLHRSQGNLERALELLQFALLAQPGFAPAEQELRALQSALKGTGKEP